MGRKEILISLVAALFLAIVLSPFASPHPDGLERVAEDKGFLEKGEGKPMVPALVPDYAWPGIQSERLATSIAGAFGTILVFVCTCLIALLINKRYGTRISR